MLFEKWIREHWQMNNCSASYSSQGRHMPSSGRIKGTIVKGDVGSNAKCLKYTHFNKELNY